MYEGTERSTPVLYEQDINSHVLVPCRPKVARKNKHPARHPATGFFPHPVNCYDLRAVPNPQNTLLSPSRDDQFPDRLFIASHHSFKIAVELDFGKINIDIEVSSGLLI